MQDPNYPSSHIKHHRATKAEVALRREALFAIVSEMKPMTVRQVFYLASVRDIARKSETGYTKVPIDLAQMRCGSALPYGWLTNDTRWPGKPRMFSADHAA